MKINPWFILLALIAAVAIFNFSGSGGAKVISYDTFLGLVNAGKVESVIFTDSLVNIKLKKQEAVATISNGEIATASNFRSSLLPAEARDNTLVETLKARGVALLSQQPSQWLPLLASFLPVIIMLGLFWFIFMRSSGGQGQVMQFGQSKARQYGKERKVNTSFSDVAGHEEVKRELVEVVDFLKNPGKYHAVGAEIPKGVLLVGPPGTEIGRAHV